MDRKGIRLDIFWKIIEGIICIFAVSAAAYLWQLPQEMGTMAVLVVYLVSFALMVTAAYLIFRRLVLHDYEQKQRLTPLPFVFQLLIWGLFFAFPCIYNPISWAWSQSEIIRTKPALGAIGWTLVVIGLSILILALLWLGLPRSCGQQANKLEISGIYRLSRNPQLMGGAILIIGYIFLWPSWYALGWLFLFAFMTHMMVHTEEQFLTGLFGEEYKRYCQQVPRYFGLPRKSRIFLSHILTNN
jgi:protein-S-isoprenylcysteine O-methyltransferase Ste14